MKKRLAQKIVRQIDRLDPYEMTPTFLWVREMRARARIYRPGPERLRRHRLMRMESSWSITEASLLSPEDLFEKWLRVDIEASEDARILETLIMEAGDPIVRRWRCCPCGAAIPHETFHMSHDFEPKDIEHHCTCGRVWRGTSELGVETMEWGSKVSVPKGES